MAILHVSGISSAGVATSAASTINAGGTLLGIPLAGLGCDARAYQTDLVVRGPINTLAALRTAYDASRPNSTATITIFAAAPTWADLDDDGRRIALLGRMLIP